MSGRRRIVRTPQAIEGTAERIDDGDTRQTLPAWATDPNTPLPLAYELRGTVHCMILGNVHETRPVVKSLLSPLELPAASLLTLAGGAWEAVTHQKCPLDMAQTIARGWLACYRQARH